MGPGGVAEKAGVKGLGTFDAEPEVASDVRVAMQSRMVKRFMPLSYGGMGGGRGTDRQTTFKIDEGRWE